MKVLIVYGTIEGQTRKIARFMEDVLQERDHKVVISNAIEEPPLPGPFDVVIVGSSIHMHKYNSAIKEYVTDHADTLNSKKSAFFSVCMAVASDIAAEHEETEALARSFLEETHWKTDAVGHMAGALKYTKYDFFKRFIMRMMAKKQGGDTDTGEDHEYTDWADVKSKVETFVGN